MEGGGRDMWKAIAAQDPAFGHPEKFCGDTEKTNWESATVTTLDDKILPYIEKICKRDPFIGKVVTGGYIKKPMRDCTSTEITGELLYHIGIPKVFGSVYDVRVPLDSTSKLMDGRKPADIKLPWIASIAKKAGLKKIKDTVVYNLLKKHNVV